MKKYQKISFSLLFALFLAAINAIDYALSGYLFNTFALITDKIIANFEYWRLFSFPFFFGSVEGTFLFVAIFLFISPHIENFLSTKFYPLFLFLISFIFGSVMSAVFISSHIVFGGMEGASFLVFTLYSMLYFNRKDVIAERRTAFAIGASSVLFWAIFKYFIAINYGFMSILPSLTIAGLGVIFAVLIYMQINYLVKKKIRKAKMMMKPIKKDLKMPTPEEISFAMQSHASFQSLVMNYGEKGQYRVSENDTENEEQLNSILDKMIECGKDSLSLEEMTFLEEYSRHIN